MENFFAVVLVIAICAFVFFQIRGVIRDVKKRKELKKQSESKLEKSEADLKEQPQNEQDGDTKSAG